MKTLTAVEKEQGTDERYHGFLKEWKRDSEYLLKHSPLFITDAEGLFELYLSHIPVKHRQHYNCRACQKFIEEYGKLVQIEEDGMTVSPFFQPAEFLLPGLEKAVLALKTAVEKAKVTGVFFSDEKVWGTPITGPWSHLSVQRPKGMFAPPMGATASQTIAHRREEYRMLMDGLAAFKLSTLKKAVALLETGTFFRDEKVLNNAKWLLELSTARTGGNVWRNIVWQAVAQAPVGWCHVRSGVLGTLLEDVQNDLPVEAIQKRFADKMDPLQYRRPTAEPAEQSIEQAEKLVEEMGIESALSRRFALADEIHTFWKEIKTKAQPSGIFGHLKKSPPTLKIKQPTCITLEKFVRTVVPKAERMTVEVPFKGNFCAYITAEDPDALPILQWDSEKKRNPFSWYVYPNGSSRAQWALLDKADVTCLSTCPAHWFSVSPNFPEHVLFVLKSCRDSISNGGLGLFPEILKSELHPVRKVIEAHSKSKQLKNIPGQLASGLCFSKGNPNQHPIRILVESAGIMRPYIIDRWD